MLKSIGTATITGYFALFYFFPVLIMAFIGPHPFFLGKGNTLLCAVVITTVYIIYLILRYTKIHLPTSWAGRLPNLYENRVFLYLLGIASLPISYKFHSDFGTGFRYSGQGLATSGFVPQYVSLYKAFFYSYVLYSFFYFVSHKCIGGAQKRALCLHTINWVLCANGSADMLWIAIAAGMCGPGNRFYHFLIRDWKYNKHAFRALLNRFAIVVLLLVVASAVIFFGYANKMGVEEAAKRFGPNGISLVAYYLYYRIYMLVASMDHVLSYGIFNTEFYAHSLAIIKSMISYRIETILGFSPVPPDIRGINQFNYYEIYTHPANNRSGSSPGPIASFLYLPFVPFNLLFSSLFLAAYSNSYDRAASIGANAKPTVVAIFFLIITCYVVMHSPLESFLKVGPELFQALFFLYALEKAAQWSGDDVSTCNKDAI